MTAMRKAYVSTPRGQLHFREAGTGPVTTVLLQVLPFGGLLFEPLLPLLAEAGVRCIAPDLMGYGRSDKRDAVWLVEDFADNVAVALEALDVRADVLLGGHFAGLVAAELARRGLAGRLVLDGAPAWPAALRASLPTRPGMAPIPMTEDGEHMLEYWARAFGMLRKLNPALEITAATAAPIRACAIAFMEASFEPGILEAMGGYDLVAALPGIALETLVLGAEADSQRAYYDQIITALPHGRGHMFAGVNPLHDIGRPDRAREYAAALLGFIRPSPTPSHGT